MYNLISTSQAIIFCNTIRKVKWLTENLQEKNFPITAIHGKMTQQERNEIVLENIEKQDIELKEYQERISNK